MISYTDSLDGLTEDQCHGFFVGWIKVPPPDVFLRVLSHSTYIVLALDTETQRVVGFINALTDKEMTAFIPMLEVLPNFQHRGIGTELMSRMLAKLKDLYMIDLTCDQEMSSFYEKFGMKRSTAMILRNMHDESRNILTGEEK